MPELRKDPLIGRWVIFSPERGKRPLDFVFQEPVHTHPSDCPFCEGNEEMTPPEVDSIRNPSSSKPNTKGWSLRVIPNKYPALAAVGGFKEKGEGVYTKSNGFGCHEVVIETPKHNKSLENQSLQQIINVLRSYIKRAKKILEKKGMEYVLIFKNVGRDAGASLEHPHSQLIGTPIIPKRILEKQEGFKKYKKINRRCLFCDIIKQEKKEKSRIVYENKSYFSFCPYASKFPFQICLLPKEHEKDILDLSNSELSLLAECLKETLLKLTRGLKKPQYNFVVNLGPKKGDFHWHLEILPRVTQVAGFEWGSDFFINPVMPEVAADTLRKA